LQYTQQDNQSYDDDYIPEEAKPLCPHCLRPCDPLSYYCPHCGSHQPINPLTAYMPFLNIRFNYGGIAVMWRRIWFVKGTPIWLKLVYLLIFIILLPTFLFLFLPLTLIFKIKKATVRNVLLIAFFALGVLLIAYFIFN